MKLNFDINLEHYFTNEMMKKLETEIKDEIICKKNANI